MGPNLDLKSLTVEEGIEWAKTLRGKRVLWRGKEGTIVGYYKHSHISVEILIATEKRHRCFAVDYVFFDDGPGVRFADHHARPWELTILGGQRKKPLVIPPDVPWPKGSVKEGLERLQTVETKLKEAAK